MIETSAGSAGGLLLDFGREIQGHVQLFTPLAPDNEPVRVRIRLGGKQNAGNDHAVRDQAVRIPWLGTQTIGRRPGAGVLPVSRSIRDARSS